MSPSLITTIPLGTAYLEAPYISAELIRVLDETRAHGKKSLVFYSRRGNARAWICADCGHYEKCPQCDIALAYHTHPTRHLICHQCNHKTPWITSCPHCHGHEINPVGVGIQQIETSLQKIYPNSMRILRIDGDVREKTTDLYDKIDTSDIILSTSIGSSIVHGEIDAVIWLCFELNLSIPSYRIEEEIYHEIAYYKKQGLPLYIQTYTPDHPLLQEIIDGNTKSFLQYLASERKAFHYPPFVELATIRIHSEQKKQVEDLMAKLVNKISLLKKPTTFLAWDTDIWERSHGEWQQKITIKDTDLMYMIGELRVEIVRNRCVTLEWG